MPTAREPSDQEVIGARLRAIRQQRGLSLKAVHIASGGEIYPNMLGAYERGEHAITAARLVRLAHLYDVSLEELFEPEGHRWGSPAEPTPAAEVSVRLDVAKLDQVRRPEAKAVARLASAVQQRRYRRVTGSIELRSDDFSTLAFGFGVDVDALIGILERTGALRRRQGRPPASSA